MKNYSIAARISEKTAIEVEDINFLKKKLKEMSQADFIRNCINTQRKFEEGKLISASNIKTDFNNEGIKEIFKEQILELINKGYLSVNNNENSINETKTNQNKEENYSEEREIEDKKEKTDNDSDLEKWSKNPDFMELLDGINDI